MRNKIFFLTLIIFSQFCFSQSGILSKIDNLKTETEVQDFIRSRSKTKEDYLAEFELKTIQSFDENSYHEVNKEIKKAADSLGITKSFYKGDFDHNGKTDLIFIGDNHSCNGFSPSSKGSYSCDSSVNIFLENNGDYILKSLKPNFHDFVAPTVTTLNGKQYLKILSTEVEEDTLSSQLKFNQRIVSRVLDYTFDSFIEYNPEPKKHQIEKIVYETGMCYGTCPMFKLELNADKISTFFAELYNFSEKIPKGKREMKKGEGRFETKISTETFDELTDILNYIDFPNLKNDYAVHWTDDHSSVLTVYYEGGKVKKIDDYGLSGTYGLKLLYKKLFELRFNQDWKKVK